MLQHSIEINVKESYDYHNSGDRKNEAVLPNVPQLSKWREAKREGGSISSCCFLFFPSSRIACSYNERIARCKNEYRKGHVGGRWVRDRMRWLIDGKSIVSVCACVRVCARLPHCVEYIWKRHSWKKGVHNKSGTVTPSFTRGMKNRVTELCKTGIFGDKTSWKNKK